MTTIYVTDEQFRLHKMQGYQHPEHPGRIESVWKVFDEAKLTNRLLLKAPIRADDTMLLRVHDQNHLNSLTWISEQPKMVMYDSDTYALPQSPEIARYASGGVVAAVDAIMTDEADNGLAAVRPPGHHATPSRAMGFCLISNIAVAARYAQATYDINKVMIVDFDVHHGNGTQDVFYADDSVLFLSTHQYPYYPGTGAITEVGAGRAAGTTINIPLGAGYGDASYARIFEDVVWSAARRFQPELILVSAGFDAHFVDPLASMRLSLHGYTHLCRELKAMAEELCGGKIVFVMEGGYDLKAISHGMRNIAHVLLGEDEISDPYGNDAFDEPEVADIIERVQSIHDL